MAKQLLAVVVVAVMISSAIGFALGTASNPQNAGAASASASSRVVTQLKKLNNKVATLNTRIGEQQQSQGSVRGLLTIICDYTAPIDCKK
jgi:peptidoglycan hydrolase CwlO-like protein